MDHRFSDQVAIVTGSSSGIGKATALRLAEEGAAICVVANRNVEGGEKTVAEIAAMDGRAIFVQADVGVGDDCRRIIDETISTLGQIDVLINNAGITRGAKLEEFEEELWDRLMNTNLKSAYLMSRFAVPHMLERGQGAMVNISSIHAEATRPAYGAYAATKAGMSALTRGHAVEFGARGIRFNCILPGTIDISNYSRRSESPRASNWIPRASEEQVMKRCGSADEVAAAIAFLASGEASFVNGATLVVDGGLMSLLKD
ncbi:MAG TPA: SDR family NAD(P)-dependent oxidoreductase [Armatimonadota bacterium]|nr:SDR family NAD(P)-dependent oxidoreductase [Armatimonadota bacterium]